jgi:hypothetical protein
MAGAVLDCTTPAGRRILAGGGVAAVRPPQVAVPGFLMGPGGASTVELDLAPGRWELESSYVSRLPLNVTAPGLQAKLPGNLDRPGPRWPIGQVTVTGDEPTPVTFSVPNPLLAPGIPFAEVVSVVANRDAKTRVVPIAQACGKYVDWYRGARPR